MNQKIKDLLLLLKTERKIQVAAFLVFVVIMAMMFMPDNRRQGSGRVALRTPPPATNDRQAVINDLSRDTYQDLIATVNRSTEANTKAIQTVTEDLRKIREQQQDYEKTTSAIFSKIIEKMNDSSNPPAQAVGNTGAVPATEPYQPIEANVLGTGEDAVSAQNVSMNLGDLQPFQTDTAAALTPPPPRGPRKVAVVTAGDSVRLKLLAGVHAPTDGTPYPVVFKLVGNVYGPDGSALSIGEARVIAAAQGSLADSRALFRLTKLSMAYPNGRRREIEVDGWVVGEDGMRGMEGRLLDPIGKVLGAGMATGFIQGMGDAMASQNITQNRNLVGGNEITVSGNEVEFAAGNGISRGADRWGRLLEERIKRLVPHVEVLSGREATAVFAKSFTIPDLMEQADAEEMQ